MSERKRKKKHNVCVYRYEAIKIARALISIAILFFFFFCYMYRKGFFIGAVLFDFDRREEGIEVMVQGGRKDVEIGNRYNGLISWLGETDYFIFFLFIFLLSGYTRRHIFSIKICVIICTAECNTAISRCIKY